MTKVVEAQKNLSVDPEISQSLKSITMLKYSYLSIFFRFNACAK